VTGTVAGHEPTAVEVVCASHDLMCIIASFVEAPDFYFRGMHYTCRRTSGRRGRDASAGGGFPLKALWHVKQVDQQGNHWCHGPGIRLVPESTRIAAGRAHAAFSLTTSTWHAAMQAHAQKRCLTLWPGLEGLAQSLKLREPSDWNRLLCANLRAVLALHAMSVDPRQHALPSPSSEFTLADYQLFLTIEAQTPRIRKFELAQRLKEEEGAHDAPGGRLPNGGAPSISFRGSAPRRSLFTGSMRLVSSRLRQRTHSQSRSTQGYFEMENQISPAQFFAQPGEPELWFDLDTYGHEVAEAMDEWVVSVFLVRSDGVRDGTPDWAPWPALLSCPSDAPRCARVWSRRPPASRARRQMASSSRKIRRPTTANSMSSARCTPPSGTPPTAPWPSRGRTCRTSVATHSTR
jgi:hypothetical protein